jgi:carbohydrate kinase (thermoresistant glucokinase family)
MHLIICFGVSGCGKSTFASELGLKLNCPFVEADSFHSQENISKMSSGTALNDLDRFPWLESIFNHIRSLAHTDYVVLACSCLKRKYRNAFRHVVNTITNATCKITFLFLKADFDIAHSRLKARKGHFVNENLLVSQFDTLETPENECDVLIIDSSESVKSNVNKILSNFTGTNL